MRGAAVLAAAALMSCTPAKSDPVSVARAYAEKEHPGITRDMDGAEQKATVTDKGDRWFVDFHTKFDATGGASHFVVRKSDLAVIDRYYSQ